MAIESSGWAYVYVCDDMGVVGWGGVGVSGGWWVGLGVGVSRGAVGWGWVSGVVVGTKLVPS